MKMNPSPTLPLWFQQHNDWIKLLLSILTISFFFFFLAMRQKNGNSKKSLPSPPRLPLLGNLHQLGSLPHRSLQSLAKKYGPLMLLHFGRVPTIIISSPELAREVMKTQGHVFASRPPSTMAKKLLYDSHDVAFAPYGDYWRQVRKISVVHLLSIKRVQSFGSVREEEVSLLIQKIRSSSGLVNLSQMIYSLSNGIVSRVALGKKYSEDFREMITEFLALFGSFPFKDYIPLLGWVDAVSGMDARVRKTSKEVDSFLERVLEEHLKDANRSYAGSDPKQGSDFVDVLLSLDDKDDQVGSISLNKDHVKALILDMFIGGTDTTSATLEWIMAELIMNQKVIKRVQEEVRGVVGPNEKIKEEDLERMNYLKAVIRETLRLHPIVPLLVSRQAMEDTQLQGYDIPAGTRVMINAWAIGRDSRSWERPEEFFPDRFRDNNIDFRGQDFQFIPFGAGRRGCPGISFAYSTIELALANLLNLFDWELPDGVREKTLDMTEYAGLTVHRKSSLILIAKSKFS